MTTSKLRIAYYCSGHGYGHATRVSAFAKNLLALNASVFIVSSGKSACSPAHIFSDSIVRGAHYRYAEIDPVIVQPLAYRIDRPKSLQVLERFLATKDEKAEHERQWLLDTSIDCVISDAAGLASLAAHLAGIPSILCTNFTFDSIFSYLGTHFVDPSSSSSSLEPVSAEEQSQDVPVSTNVLDPLVTQLFDAYRCADLLLLLPGAIPIPSFMPFAELPSPTWLDDHQRFLASIAEDLQRAQLPSNTLSPTSTTRDIVPTPLLVRDPSIDVYERDSRSRLLSSIGIPDALHDHKILVVSFGGQRIVPPRSVSGSASRQSPAPPQDNFATSSSRRPSEHGHLPEVPEAQNGHQSSHSTTGKPHHHTHEPHHASHFQHPHELRHHVPAPRAAHSRLNSAQELMAAIEKLQNVSVRELPPTPATNTENGPKGRQILHIATPSHMYVPGAPGPVSPPGSAKSLKRFPFAEGLTVETAAAAEEEPEEEPTLLPDDTWIAVVCGAGDTWDSGELPERFFVAPKDVWMPDLTAIADVLMGKLGYSTCAECVDSCTPFVFVPRPLFLEEAGLRILIQTRGVGLEMTREQYESGDWATLVQQAWELGREKKAAKIQRGVDTQRQKELRTLAGQVLEWIRCRRQSA
ncbi:hypothetical protein EXIGLDRAFT_664914 [Exidia glandulosa HHB12029]|uniref:Uncharacterized protein n=1 Tax=Exidia glandulosa HHB12029 TaxID=1314781 RepID=A0A165PZU9_EXIGL|nr:hypothetical protein EXIGLDRAFT_664914 [Exidia glandulosa HHB12029]